MTDDRFVRVGDFMLLHEAYLAKSLLENEGISVAVEGEEVASTFTGSVFGTEGVRLLVRAADADRATMLLAEAQAEAKLDEGEARPSYRLRGTWICRSCDTPVSVEENRCPECDSPRADFHADDPRGLRPRGAGDRPRARVEAVQATPPPPPNPDADADPGGSPADTPDLTLEPYPTVPPGDAMVYRAFRATVLGLFVCPVMFFATYMLFQAMFDKRIPQPTDKAVPWFYATAALQAAWWLAGLILYLALFRFRD